MRILFVYGSAVTGPVGQVGELPSSRRHKVTNRRVHSNVRDVL